MCTDRWQRWDGCSSLQSGPGSPVGAQLVYSPLPLVASFWPWNHQPARISCSLHLPASYTSHFLDCLKGISAPSASTSVDVSLSTNVRVAMKNASCCRSHIRTFSSLVLKLPVCAINRRPGGPHRAHFCCVWVFLLRSSTKQKWAGVLVTLVLAWVPCPPSVPRVLPLYFFPHIIRFELQRFAVGEGEDQVRASFPNTGCSGFPCTGRQFLTPPLTRFLVRARYLSLIVSC